LSLENPTGVSGNLKPEYHLTDPSTATHHQAYLHQFDASRIAGLNGEPPQTIIASSHPVAKYNSRNSKNSAAAAQPPSNASLTMSQLGTVYATKRRRRNGKR
jgi:hypothetical protein